MFIQDPVIRPIWNQLLKAFDTKNRILETEEEARPTASEVGNATQRVDDATVAIRSELANLQEALGKGSGFYDQASFEATSGLVWANPAA